LKENKKEADAAMAEIEAANERFDRKFKEILSLL